MSSVEGRIRCATHGPEGDAPERARPGRPEVDRAAPEVAELRGSVDDLTQRLRAIVDLAIDGIVTIDRHGTVESFNRAAERIFGYRADEVLGRNVRMLMPSPDADQHDAYLERYRRTGLPRIIGVGREVVGRRKDGSCFPLHLGVSEVVLGHETIFTAVLRDLTELRRAEAEARAVAERAAADHAKLLRTERLATLGILAAEAAHEIKNPLMGALACLRALASGRLPGERREQYVETAIAALERAERAAHGLLDATREDAPKPERVELEHLVDSCLRLLAPIVRDKGVRILDVTDAPAAAAAVVDRAQLLQSLVNVVLNAVQAVAVAGAVRIALVEDGDRIGIDVEDDGPGLSPEQLERAVEPFFTTKPRGEGTGLGLAVTSRLLAANGGALTIRRGEVVGTVVTLWVPRAR